MPIATALIVAAAAYQAQRSASGSEGDTTAGGNDDSSSSSPPPPDITPDFLEGKTSVELLPLEQSLTMLESPISTVSFYQFKESPDDDVSSSSVESLMDSTIDKMNLRVQAILKANPWLGGWLVRGKGVGSFDQTPRLWFDPTANEMSSFTIFQRISHAELPLTEGTPYEEYESILGGHDATVKTNPQIENRKEEPLFRVTVIPSPDNTGFALIVSMSHICGDGHTFYRIYNMLVGSDPIVAMIPQRELIYSSHVMELMGRQEAHYVQHLTTDPSWMKLFRLGSNVSQAELEDDSSKLRGRVFLINRHWIGNLKASHMTEGNITDVATSTLRSPMTPAALNDLERDNDNPTQSTNDILVSFFWNLVKPTIGLMAVNFRRRLDIVTRDHAGNYANPIPYTQEDYKSPVLIRKSLENCRRAGVVAGVNDSFPTTLPRASPDLSFSIITNWSSFLSETHVQTTDDDMDWNNGDDVKLIRHLPIVYPKRMMAKMPSRMSFLIIFSSTPEDIGCMLIAPGRVMEEIDSCGVVKETIAEF